MQSKARLRKKLESKEKKLESKEKKLESKEKTTSTKSKSEKNEKVSTTDERHKEEGEKNSHINIDYKRIMIRCIAIIAIILVVNYAQGNKLETFASEKEEIKLKEDIVECSTDFLRSVKRFKGCVPKTCGRFVTDTHLSLSEVQALSVTAQKVFTRIGPQGREGEYATFDLYSGTLTKGNSVVNVYKTDNTHKIVTSEDLKIYRYVTDKVKAIIVDQFGLTPESVYMAQPTFFSRIDPLFTDSFIREEYWSPRIDKVKFPSLAYTAHLFLTDYDYHFKGGRLVFVDQHVNKTVEPKVGRLVAFTSGSENVNYIERVTSGTRFEIMVPFTCDPKKDIKDIKFRS